MLRVQRIGPRTKSPGHLDPAFWSGNKLEQISMVAIEPVRRSFRLPRAKTVVFALILAMTVYVIGHNERFLVEPDNPVWQQPSRVNLPVMDDTTPIDHNGDSGARPLSVRTHTR